MFWSGNGFPDQNYYSWSLWFTFISKSGYAAYRKWKTGFAECLQRYSHANIHKKWQTIDLFVIFFCFCSRFLISTALFQCLSDTLFFLLYIFEWITYRRSVFGGADAWFQIPFRSFLRHKMNPTMAATRITGSVNMKTVIFPVVSVTMVEHRMQHELPVVQW